MQGEERTRRRELLAAHFEKMGSTETESAVVQRYRIQGLQHAGGIVAWPRRGDTTRLDTTCADGGHALLDGCWGLRMQDSIVRFNPRTARQQARDGPETGARH